MTKKHGLGRGLGALIPDMEDENEDNSVQVKENKYVTNISINLIKSNPDQPRKNFDSEKISSLAESINEHGIIQPIVLKKHEDTYIIIAGERRWRAAKLIGLKEVPVIVMEDIDNNKILEVSLIENIQREDLDPIEEALAYKKLIEEFNLTQEDLSRRIGKSRTAIANCMRLLNLDDRVQEYIVDGVITEGHGRALLSIEDGELQYEISKKIIDEDLSVREIEKLVKSLKDHKDKNITKESKSNPYINDIQNRLQEHFSTKVSLINKKDNKGKIQIEYYSEEDLQRILDMFSIS